ncbi:serine hydrolase domain-containing protein [Sphingosinicella rhizophila]|uniref:Serine hydrolase domain-containing protein n=1 Tax=Sphingosinicella rhizophila TaxID=3050082 RepID=A0ABU3QCB2_9SPHN|nr:serine hydrolase domain-containing protein [Sphingosinicella sp. GR2756]MDT9600613.1 serine hydrolase domain-containing protein [Sphingosinicella sp. GR2756]
MKSYMFVTPFRGAAAAMALLAHLGTGPVQASAGAEPAAQIDDDTAIAARIDRAAIQAIKAGESVGLQIAVVRNGKELLVSGYGSADLEQAAKVTAETVFRVGSVTKQFTAAAILLLAEDGKLSVDDRLSKFFPDFPRGGEITLRQMLTHTSGLRDFTGDPAYAKDSLGEILVDDMVTHIKALSPLYEFEPGTAWSYSNSAYFMLGAIVAKVSGKPFGDFLKERLFDRLGMARTAMDDLADIVPQRASGYEAVPHKRHLFRNARSSAMSWIGGAGALRSTAADLAKWADALHGGRVLKPASYAMMIRPALLKNGQPVSTAPTAAPLKFMHAEYGFGLLVGSLEGHQKIGHGGGIEGFAASLNSYPAKGVTIVVLSNTIGGPAGAGTGKVAEKIERIAIGAPPAAASTP